MEHSDRKASKRFQMLTRPIKRKHSSLFKETGSSSKDLQNKLTPKCEKREAKQRQLKMIRNSRYSGIIDIDDEYFTLVRGRSPRKSERFCRQKYIEELNDITRQNITTGFMYDKITKLDTVSDIERYKLNEIKNSFFEVKSIFEIALADEHSTALEILDQTLAEEEITEEKRKILLAKQDIILRLRSEIFSLQDIYDKYHTSMIFVYKLSGVQCNEDVPSHLSNDYSTGSTEESINKSIMDLSTELQLERHSLPELIFKSPIQVFERIRNLEIHNRKLMLHTDDYKAQYMQRLAAFNIYVTFAEREVNVIQAEIESIKDKILCYEENDIHFKKMIKHLLKGDYKTVNFSKDYVDLKLTLERVHAYIFNRNSTYENSKYIVSEIIREYRSLMFEIEGLPEDKCLRAFLKAKDIEEHKIKDAYHARAVLSQVDAIKKNILRSFKPIVKVKRKLVFRSNVPDEKEKEEEEDDDDDDDEKDSKFCTSP